MKKSHAEKPAEAVQEEQIEPKAWADGIPVYCAHDEIVATRSLTPNPQNPNQHPAEQVKKLAKVIRGNGWRQPITVSTRSGMIVKGHGRLLAAQLEDLDAVPVDYQNYETEAAELADLWADNYIAELAETDNRLAASILASIQNAGADLELAGSSPEEYDAIVQAITGAAEEDEDDDAGDEEPDEEEQIEPPAEPVTQRGDVWILGDHRVMCGDCTNLEDRALLLNGATPEVLLTDPPYCSGGQKESAKSTGSIGTKHADGKQPMIANDILSTRGYQNLIAAAKKLAEPFTHKMVKHGGKPRAARVMIIGIPNVGKSSLINRLSGGAHTKIENRPGVTRAKQWIKLEGDLELLDTPGILWSKFDDPIAALKLAWTFALKDEIYDLERTVCLLLETLAARYPSGLIDRFKLDEPLPADGAQLLESIGRKRGCLRKGGALDLDKAQHIVMTEFRCGKLGRITLDLIEDNDPK